ncbi:MAG TPA: hypothetical protein VFE65_18675 [Pseudonocardia sp.]|jgi:uncharacterized membrane protein|nr:hypothetical protein [Pseudonocardia sp.]
MTLTALCTAPTAISALWIFRRQCKVVMMLPVVILWMLLVQPLLRIAGYARSDRQARLRQVLDLALGSLWDQREEAPTALVTEFPAPLKALTVEEVERAA